jgi:hypothetical protein
MTTQDKYTDTLRQAQEAWTAAAQSLQKAFTQPVKPWGDTDPAAAIDQIFDFWEQSLSVQRELAKQLVGMTVATGESVRSQAKTIATTIQDQTEAAGAAIRQQVETVSAAARQQVEATEQAAHAEAVKQYDDLTKEELQEELARRSLPKTGKVNGLRERLVANDQK